MRQSPASALPVLYSFRRCPYAMRARLAIAVSGVQVEHREVVLRDKPQALLDASPKATVPVLVLPDGRVIEQSLDVMLWALAAHDPQGWLGPDAAALDAMVAYVAQNDGDFKQHLDRYKYPNRYPDEWTGADAAAFMAKHRGDGARWLAQLQERLAKNAFLFGASQSLADMAILPFVRQFAHTDAAWFAAQSWPQLRAWLATFEAGALYENVMQKHMQWKP